MSNLPWQVLRERLTEIQECPQSNTYFTSMRSELTRQLAVDMGIDLEKSHCHCEVLEQLYDILNNDRQAELRN